MSSVMVEAEDRWLIPMAGRDVERLCIDFAVSLSFDGGFELRIEQSFVIVHPDGSEVLVSLEGGADHLAPALHLARHEVAAAEALKDGRLEVSFSDGTILRIPADEVYEAWELAGPDGLRAVSLPGGDLAIWQPSSPA